MDATTLMTLMGLTGVNAPMNTRVTGLSSAQLDVPGLDTPTMPAAPSIQAPPFYPQGTPIIPQGGYATPDLSGTRPQPKQGGFSTGNILTALLGSNFGQK